MTIAIDERAKKILFDTHWTSKGWLDQRKPPTPEDRAHAVAHGLMFEPYTGTLFDVQTRIRVAIETLDHARLAAAFLASLSSRRLDLRSGIASYLIAFNWGPKPGEENERYESEDLDVLSFERHKWGGVRLGQALYTMLDLECHVREPMHAPTKEDVAIMNAILARAASADAKLTPAKLADQLKDLLPSSKDERNTLVEILGACFVLQPKTERDTETEFEYVGDWRGADGVNATQVEALFASFGVKVPKAKKAAQTKPAAKAKAKAKAKTKPVAKAKTKPAAKPTKKPSATRKRRA